MTKSNVFYIKKITITIKLKIKSKWKRNRIINHGVSLGVYKNLSIPLGGLETSLKLCPGLPCKHKALAWGMTNSEVGNLKIAWLDRA